MDIDAILAIASPYGPVGLLCAYLIWREHRRDKRDDEREKRDEEIRASRADADKDLAVALTLLSERINVRSV